MPPGISTPDPFERLRRLVAAHGDPGPYDFAGAAARFRAGQLQDHAHNWRAFFRRAGTQLPSWVGIVISKGLRLPLQTLNGMPVASPLDLPRIRPEGPRNSCYRTPEHTAFVDREAASMLALGVTRVATEEDVRLIRHRASLLVVDKAGPDKFRLCLDATPVNPFIRLPTFRYQTLDEVASYLTPGCWLVKFDLKKGYYHIALEPSTQRLLSFEWRGVLYVYQALCFGVNIACFAFTKFTRAFAKYWAALGVKLCTYIDDGLFICPSREIAELVSMHLRAIAPDLGITFSEKSDFTPTQLTEYLGIVIDVRPESGVFAVTAKKVAKTLARVDEALDQPSVSARRLQKLAGSLIALRMAFPAVRLMTRPLFGLMSTADALADPFNESLVTIEGPARECLEWLRAALRRGSPPEHPIWTPRSFYRLFTDASGYGYAAFLDKAVSFDAGATRQREAWSVFGTFPAPLRASDGPMKAGDTSSNERELRAIVAAADDLFPLLPAGAHVLIRCDNRSAVAAVARGGGSARLFDLSVRLWHRCAALGVFITARHLPGEANVFADRGSRDGARAPALNRSLLERCRHLLGQRAAAHHHVAFEDDLWLGDFRPAEPTVLTVDSRLRPALIAALRDRPASAPLGLLLPVQPSTTWSVALADLRARGASVAPLADLPPHPNVAAEELADWQGAAFAPRTTAGQRRAARRYFAFTARHDLAPAAERSVLLFLADATASRRRTAGADLAPSTIGGLAAHIWRELKLRGLVDPAQPRSFMYQTAWRGMKRRLGRPVQQRRALLPGDVRAWFDTSSFGNRAPAQRLRDAALLAVGIAGFLRGAELVALRMGDVTCETEPSPRIALHVRRSKTDQEARGAVVYLTPARHSPSCPVRLLASHLSENRAEAPATAPLFPRLSDPSTAVTAGFLRRLVKEVAGAVGHDPADFSGHSLRRGGATAAARRGLPATWIRRHGRWALYSSVPQGYIEDYLFLLSSDLADLGF
eukprot:tig00021133_g18919.t1